jgi:hypothetical protein
MKYIVNIGMLIALILTIASCQKDFLDQQPLDVLSTTNNLSSTNELRLYINQFYEKLPGHPTVTGGTGIAFDDANSDNMIFTSVNTRLNGGVAISNATTIDEYTTIRSLNYFIENYKHATGNQGLIDQYLGEAKFFRAYFYFNLVKKYGPVTWVNHVIAPDQPETQASRYSRLLVIDSVLSDLDQAIDLLPSINNSATMRVHKDVALTFKSRVALYEGTWEKYHRLKGDQFYAKEVTDKKIRDYFTQAKVAANTVMSSGRWAISTTGKPLVDYGNLFTSKNLSADREVMLWRKYDANDNIGHSISKYLSTDGGDIGLTLSLVDDYLTRTGTPFTGEIRNQVQTSYGAELMPDVRDPRLSQTAGIPGKPLRPGVVVPAFPPINQSGFNRSTTGFPLYKYIEYTDMSATSDDFKSSVPAIQFRYAEVLLNYAEAIAELGEDQNQIKVALQPLRDRAGMPGVDFDREYNTDPNYPFRSLNKVLQSVRRERRIEFAAEGSRLDDILRWAAADILIVGKRPLGVLFAGSNIEKENSSTGFYKDAPLYFDAAPAGKSINFYLTGGSSDAKRYMDPYQKTLPSGYGFNLQRDYLLPVQDRMIQLTNGNWTQNPGW